MPDRPVPVPAVRFRGVGIEIEGVLLPVGCIRGDGRADVPVGQESIDLRVGLESHPVVPGGGLGGDGGGAPVAAQAGLPVAVGQEDPFQDKGTGRQGRVREGDGDFADAGLAHQPLHGDFPGFVLTGQDVQGQFPHHHQTRWGIVFQAGLRFQERLPGCHRGGLERGRGIGDGHGQIGSRLHGAPDGGSRAGGPVIGQFPVLEQHQRPVLHRPFVRSSGRAGPRAGKGKGDPDPFRRLRKGLPASCEQQDGRKDSQDRPSHLIIRVSSTIGPVPRSGP